MAIQLGCDAVSARPDFLVIGAMKCGTTTLFEDLRSNPSIFIPDKETSGLVEFDVMSLAGRTAYEELFKAAPASSLIGEVATTYAMRPHFTGVPERAKSILPNVKVVYIVREPVSRIISHHRHDFSSGALTMDIDDAVRQDPRLLDYTRYATQLLPWIDAFGVDSVRVLRFESYINDRAGTMSDLFAFLGAGTPSTSTRFDKAHNVSEGKRVATGGWRQVTHSRFYRNRVRPMIPETVRQRIARVVLPQAPIRPHPPGRETVRLILDELWPEVEQLCAITGSSDWWDPAEVWDQYEPPHS